MKILVYCHEFPPVGGGAGNALYHLARCWVRDGGCDVTVVTSACAGLELSQKVDGITVNRLEVGRHLPWRATLWQMLRFMTASILTSGRFYRQARPDICVAFMTMPGGPGPRMIKKRFGVPYVCQIRGGDVPGFGSSFLNRIHGVASHFIVSTWNKSDFVIANGKGLAQLASKTRLRCPVKVLPNGVDSDFFTPDPALRSWAAHETLKILFAGRLVDAQKKISTLLEAIRGLEQVHLTIVGDGPDRSLLAEQVKRLRLEAHVRFAGWLDKVALRRAYQEANAYVSASLYEGMSNTALEAMSCGLPLILSDIPGHQELVVSRENGLLFGPGDHGQLAEFLTGLSADAALGAAMSRQGRRLACERFSWSELARQHLDLFAAALRAKR